MKYYIFQVLAIILFFNINAQQSCSSLFHLKSKYDDEINNIRILSNNHLLVAATTSDSSYLNNNLVSVNSSSAAVILELDNNHNVIFSKSFTLSNAQSGDFIQSKDVLKDNDGNYYLLVNWKGNLKLSTNDSINSTMGSTLVKINASGQVMWYFYLNNTIGTSLSFDNNNIVLLSHSPTQMGYNPSTINIIKINKNTGQIIKTKIGSNPWKNIISNKIIFNNNKYYVSLSFYDSIVFNNTKIIGNKSSSAVLKLDTNFNIINKVILSNHVSNPIEIMDMIIDSNQNIFLCGYYQGLSLYVNDTLQLSRTSFGTIPQMYLGKFSSNLQLQWIKQENHNPSNNNSYNVRYAYKLAENGNNLYTLSYFNNSIILGIDTLTGSSLLLIQYDKNGNYIQSEKIAGTGLSGIYSLNYNPYNQKILLSSKFTTNINICNNNLIPNGFTDTYLTELDKITSIPKFSYLSTLSSLYPNPCNNYLYINTSESNVTYDIFNIYGNSVMQGILPSNKMINTTHLNNGIYLLKINSYSNSHSVIKFIVQH